MSDRALAVLLTLLAYKAALVGIGVWASRRTRDTTDFYLGGRRLGSWVAALSASASSSSAWTLLGVSGAAFALGLPALWLFPATLLGFVVNWAWVAPRLQRLSRASNSLTLSEFLAGDPAHPLYPAILRLASAVIFISFVFYVASQFEASGKAFASTFGTSAAASVLIGAGVVVLYTLLGGFWAVSVTDTLQGLLMAATAVVLPLVALVSVGGPAGLLAGLAEVRGGGASPLTGEHLGLAGLAFAAGTLGIGLGYPGQPHVVNRFMALRDAQALGRGRVIALSWAAVIYAGMLLLGLCGRLLFAGAADGEGVFFDTAHRLLPPVISGIMVAAVLSAIMSTADSQLLVAASAVSHDLRQAGHRGAESLARSRAVVLVISLLAVAIALLLPERIFSRVLFAWHAVGSAFGPVLLVRLTGRSVRPDRVLAAMAAGFGLTVLFYLLPDTPGDALERLGPFGVALALAWTGRAPGSSATMAAGDKP